MRLCLSLFLTSALVLAACRTPTEADGVSVVTSITPASLRLGTVAEIRTTITNHGIMPRIVGTTGVTGCGAIRVTSPSGAEVGRLDSDCDGSLTTRTLYRGEQIVLRRPWEGDIRTGDFPQALTRLPPGEYVLRTRIALVSGEYGSEGGRRGVDAEPVVVRVIP